jgi:DNA-binding NarL/FixJ family response regulator
MIYDNDLAVLPIEPANMQRGAIFVRVKSLIEALVLMYDHMWSVATPIFCAPTADTAPSGRPARILELLALGNKDVAIARSLGIGVRSVRRDVAELKQQLGAKSRAEVTVAAIRKGWL